MESREINVIDMISNKHSELRKAVMDNWNETYDEEITYAEGYLLSIASQKYVSPSQAAKIMRISRQAAHKCALNLESKGYLTLECIQGNKKGKHIALSSKGKEYIARSTELKMQMERKICDVIGEDKVMLIKELFSSEWITVRS